MRKTRLLTIDDLAEYCQKYQFYQFSANDAGFNIAIQVPGNMIFENKDETDDLLRTTVRVCHTLKNANRSYISEENMKKAMPTLKNKPVLASIIENDDGELDFNGHDMRIVDNADGEHEIEYIERQVGSFTEDDPTLEYDAEYDKTYVIAKAVIPREYTKAAEIMERRGGTDVSCELSVNDFKYNAKEKYLEITDFYFSGVTLLGEHVKPGMVGSRADLHIEDFSAANNSIMSNFGLTQSTSAEDKNLTKGGSEMDKLNELLSRYNKTTDDLPFASEVANMTDEELEERFAQLFDEDANEGAGEPDPAGEPSTEGAGAEEGNEGGEGSGTEPETKGNEEPDAKEPETEPAAPAANEDEPKKNTYSINLGETQYTFELSLNERLEALSRLVNDAYSEVDSAYYCVTAYADYLIMVNCWEGTAYRQKYSENEEGVFALVGDREQVYCQYLSQAEIDALESLKTSYAKMVADTEQKKRDEVLNDAAYSSIRNTDEWNELVKTAGNFSAQDLSEKADALFGRFCKQSASMGAIGISYTPAKSKKDAPYGNLFA